MIVRDRGLLRVSLVTLSLPYLKIGDYDVNRLEDLALAKFMVAIGDDIYPKKSRDRVGILSLQGCGEGEGSREFLEPFAYCLR